MDAATLLPWLALEAIPGLGPETARKLLEAYPDPAAIFHAGRARLAPLVGDQIAAAIGQGIRPEQHQSTLDWLAAPENHFIPITNPAYPDQLRTLPGAPPWLYLKGEPAWLARPMLAIVGSRNATPQGLRDAQAFAQLLAEAGFVIVSGLAEGIDAAAHEGALLAGGTLAVVGTGLDRVYPAKHRDLAHRIAAQGALVSEFPLGTPPKAGHFPRRNRIISGLSLGVLVVEAALNSGSLITARLAGDQGREVFALPGSIHSALSKGCHLLIKQGAKLVESATDILEELRCILPATDIPQTDRAFGAQGEEPGEDDSLLALLGPEPIGLDELLARSGLTVDGLSAMLLTHELEGRIAALPGGRYQRIY